jgi:hypothetical protein
MPEGPDGQYRALLDQQVAMNRQSWSALAARGVSTSSELRLDFAFRAPNEAAARALTSLLSDQTDYEVAVQSESAGIFRKRWSVIGHTQPTMVSPDILDQWVDWMITAGVLSGGCEFDGWGTEV